MKQPTPEELKAQRNRLDKELRRLGKVRRNFTKAQLKSIRKPEKP